MDLILRSDAPGSHGVFGSFQDPLGNILVYTLEHSYLVNGVWVPKISRGITYTCKRVWSPHFKCELFELQNVPGHDHVRIHPGNSENDSQGCIIVGSSIFNFVLQDSRKALGRFMDLQTGLQTFQLTC